MPKKEKGASPRRRRQTSDGKRFERLTAGLHSLLMAGADVRWDEKIIGRQVDVSVRFVIGGYEFLTIIDCKDRGRRSTRDDIVVLEERREVSGAHKAVLVSARGFQSGAREYAASKNIELFTLQELPADWTEVVTAALPALLMVKSLYLERADGVIVTMPDDRAARCLSLGRVRSQKGRVLTVNQSFQEFIPANWRARVGDFGIRAGFRGEPWLLTIDGLPDLRITALWVRVETNANPGTITSRRPPEQRPTRLVYRNERHANADAFATRDIPINLNQPIEGQQFYRDVDGREYCFENPDGDHVVAVLLGSVQHGRKLYASARLPLDRARRHYVKIEAADDIERLRAELEIWREAEAKGLTRVAGFVPNAQGDGIHVPPGFFD